MINYSKSMLYKLCCKDPDITDVYIGSTVNFNRRKSAHKSICCDENRNGYNIHVYKFIRENGGWSNWDMIVVETYCATDKQDLHRRERYYLELLNATLNKQVPTRTQGEYYQDNFVKIVEYRKKNSDKMSEYQIEYRKNNPKKIREYRKNRKEKVTCDCGCIVSKSGLTRHRKSLKHINKLEPKV